RWAEYVGCPPGPRTALFLLGGLWAFSTAGRSAHARGMHDWQRIDREVLMMKRNDALRGARTGAKNGGKNWLKIVGLSSLAAVAVVNGFRWSSEGSLKAFLTDIYTSVSQAIDWKYHWWRLPALPAIFVLLASRVVYRRKNLVDTGTLPTVNPLQPKPFQQRYLTARTPDGTYNDLTHP